MPASFMMISQAIWAEAMVIIVTLESKFLNIKGNVKPWVDTQLANQDKWVQLRLGIFKLRMTLQLSNGQTPDIIEVNSKVVEIKNMVDELYEKLIIPKLVVTIVMPKVHINNIWAILNW